jgi:hypothetical protein
MSNIIKLNDGKKVRVKVYCPMPHHIMKDHWRVPMWHIEGKYSVCVGKDYIRNYTDDTLPLCIKSKLPFARVRADHIKPSSDYVAERWGINEPTVYICPEELKDLENIAWQIAPSLYIIVLDNKELNSLKGERLYMEMKNDTRSKGKKQSKKDSRFTRLLSLLTSNWRLW